MILAITQFSVAIDTYYAFIELSRLKGDLSGSLSSIADSNVDTTWVPTLATPVGKDQNYGKNKLFNYFIIRLIHFLNNQVGKFALYPAVVTLSAMMILSAYDLFEIYQDRFSKIVVQRVGFWLRVSLYIVSLMLIILQTVVLLLENGNVSHMEVMYPFLFAYGAKEKISHEMLLKTGTRALKRRLVACFLFNLGSLVPDTYLILVNTVQPLRFYVIVNSLKMAASMVILAACFMGCIVHHYVTAGLDPKLMSDKTTINIMSRNHNIAVDDIYPNTGWNMDARTHNSSYIGDHYKFLPVFDLGDTITSRISRTTKLLHPPDRTVLSPPKFFDPVEATEPGYSALKEQKGFGVYTFVQDSFVHARLILRVFIRVSAYIWVVSLCLAICNFSLVYKRHKFLLYINVLVDLIAMAVHFCNALMAKYPIDGADFFCEIKDYIPAASGASFEAMTIYSWMCRCKEMFTLVFATVVVMPVLCIGNLVVLYLLWR